MKNSQQLQFLLKDCANGFYQQMYFLGKDVVHSDGNQLLKYGFEKSPSLGLKGTSCYGKTSHTDMIELYGSCAGIYSETSQLVFLRKRCRFYHWLPKHRLVSGQWSQEDIHSGNPSEIFSALEPLLKWWVEYELWIEKRLGTAYRQQCYREWDRIKSRPTWLPPATAIEWVASFLDKQGEMTKSKQFV